MFTNITVQLESVQTTSYVTAVAKENYCEIPREDCFVLL